MLGLHIGFPRQASQYPIILLHAHLAEEHLRGWGLLPCLAPGSPDHRELCSHVHLAREAKRHLALLPVRADVRLFVGTGVLPRAAHVEDLLHTRTHVPLLAVGVAL